MNPKDEFEQHMQRQRDTIDKVFGQRRPDRFWLELALIVAVAVAVGMLVPLQLLKR